MLDSESISRTMNPKVDRVQREYRFGNFRPVWSDRSGTIDRLGDERTRVHPVPYYAPTDIAFFPSMAKFFPALDHAEFRSKGEFTLFQELAALDDGFVVIHSLPWLRGRTKRVYSQDLQDYLRVSLERRHLELQTFGSCICQADNRIIAESRESLLAIGFGVSKAPSLSAVRLD